MAILGALLLLAWLSGGAYVAWRKGTVERREREAAARKNREATATAVMAEIRWMVVFSFDWSVVIGEARGGTHDSGERITWQMLADLALREEKERHVKLMHDHWGRPVRAWETDDQVLAVISAGANGIFEDGEGDDVWIGLTEEMFIKGKTRLVETIKKKGEAIELRQ